ncbi:hypothetical protein LTR35_006763 [Friedmanniomyces endolithicus]|uniref:Thioredoxin domain-containing protein n=1 Tax=Friedmanniomyces endolithicus TaxID=329885 RepID=A0AAN6FHD5_9PEZI|nr:hypothetical protein LTR35_006763 [Friedmanniomyces endolithicus]KAK0296974.1 hypothetical protein LTS00_004253 [Friedmanniomyces endolithicus]KAK0315047.1 hypothetical protein LTR82_012828 [Friedmanniomyces endolithicus]KAK1011938.1 hypothetical protein LTR54_004793 [Friedmanniomyces endolithicus]
MTSRDRSVSPVGASRFEQPLKAPVNGVRRVFASNASSPTSTTSAYTRGGHSSTASTSVATTTNTSTSTPTSSVLPSHPIAKDTPAMPHSPYPSRPSPSPSLDADEWLARFRSDPDLPLTSTDECPDRATLAAVYDLPIYSSDGASRPFGSLYDPSYALHTRQLVLFVRHFYCGACQAYLTALAQGISKEDYFAIPVPTSIIVIGCGQPDLIKHYKRFTSCPFPIFADPSRSLFKKLGMSLSANIGRVRPEYMKDISAPAWLAGQVSTVKKSLKDPEGIRKRDVLRGGNPMQIGGEFLFEDGEVVWCHRMRDYRGHAEVGVLREVLGLEG